VRLEIHGAEFPLPHRVLNAFQESLVLLVLAYFKPILDKNDAIILKQTFEIGTVAKKGLVLLLGTKAHYVFNESSVVPTPVENYDLAGGGHLLYISLDVHLRFVTFCWSRQGDVMEHSRTDAFHDAMDHSALSSCVAALEYNDNPRPGGFDPFLHLDELRLKFSQFPRILFARKLAFFLGAVIIIIRLSWHHWLRSWCVAVRMGRPLGNSAVYTTVTELSLLSGQQ
jgi:hypothetical protein